MVNEGLRREYKTKIENVKKYFNDALGDGTYPVDLYMMSPDSCFDYDLIEQCYGRPKIFCAVSEKFSEDDAIPLLSIARWYPIEIVPKETINEDFINIYEGTYSSPTKVCLWTLLKENNILSKTSGRYANIELNGKKGLHTSPHAVKFVARRLTRKPENEFIAAQIIDECLKSSMDKYF